MSTQDTNVIFRHVKVWLKCRAFPSWWLNKVKPLPVTTRRSTYWTNFSHLYTLPKKLQQMIEDIQHEDQNITNFSVTQKGNYQNLINFDVTKLRGANGYPPLLYQKTADRMGAFLHFTMKNIKCLRIISENRKKLRLSRQSSKKRQITGWELPACIAAWHRQQSFWETYLQSLVGPLWEVPDQTRISTTLSWKDQWRQTFCLSSERSTSH